MKNETIIKGLNVFYSKIHSKEKQNLKNSQSLGKQVHITNIAKIKSEKAIKISETNRFYVVFKLIQTFHYFNTLHFEVFPSN